MKIYNKLVRDKIPDIIQGTGKSCSYHIADQEEYCINEEATEFTEDPCLDEAADIITVFAALLEAYNLDMGEVVIRAFEKEKDRGVFESKIILESVED